MAPSVNLLVSLLSGGIYLPYWLASITCSINKIDGLYFKKSPSIKKKLPIYYSIFFTIYFVLVAGFIHQKGTGNFAIFLLLLFIMGLAVTILYFTVIIKAANTLKRMGAKLPNNGILFILSIYLISPLLLQIQVNKLANDT